MTSEFAGDPLLYSHALHVVETFYPSGFGVELHTDSPEIASAAAGIWAGYPKLFDRPPVRLRIAVSASDAETRPIASMPRGQENLVSFNHGAENFAVADLARGFGFACLTRDVALHHAYAVHHFLEPLAWLLLAAKHVTIPHAACISLNGQAVLLAGDSGSGKTCLSYGCSRLGWTFLSGDAVQFVRGANDGMVIGRPCSIRFREDARNLFPELARHPITNSINGKVDIEPPVDELGLSTAMQASAAHIVFLKRLPDTGQALLRPVSAHQAFRNLEQVIFFGDNEFREEQRQALVRFIEPCSSFELTYADLAQAEAVLRSLATGAAGL